MRLNTGSLSSSVSACSTAVKSDASKIVAADAAGSDEGNVCDCTLVGKSAGGEPAETVSSDETGLSAVPIIVSMKFGFAVTPSS